LFISILDSYAFIGYKGHVCAKPVTWSREVWAQYPGVEARSGKQTPLVIAYSSIPRTQYCSTPQSIIWGKEVACTQFHIILQYTFSCIFTILYQINIHHFVIVTTRAIQYNYLLLFRPIIGSPDI